MDDDRNTDFLETVKFDFEERQKIERTLEWVVELPEEAAAYIVWLERELSLAE